MLCNFSTLFKELPVHECQKGQVLISPDETPRGVFYLHDGYIKVYDIGPEGNCQLLSIIAPNDVFPIHWALDDDSRELFYETMSVVQFSILPKHAFKEQVFANKPLLTLALKTILVLFRASQQRVQNLQLHTARERVAFRLLYLAKYHGTKTGDKIRLEIPLTYQDLADALNITRETVNRLMRSLLNEKIVMRYGSHITILELPKLLRMAGTDTTLDY